MRSPGWRVVPRLYAREMRCALRDRTIVSNTILLPVLMYPFVIWLAFTVMSLVMSRSQGLRPEVGVSAGFTDPSATIAALSGEGLSVLETDSSTGASMVADGTLAAMVSPSSDAPAGLQSAVVLYDGSSEAGRTAAGRAEDALSGMRERAVRRLLPGIGVTPLRWAGFRMRTANTASSRQMGSFILSLMIPATFVVMVSVGCFYTAIDAFAGERERATFETLLSTSAPRFGIIASKYLYVATFGVVSGLLNLGAIAVSVPAMLAPLLRSAGESISFELGAGQLATAAGAGVLLALFLSSGMLLFACVARNFKEGQAMVTPFYLAAILPVMFLQTPGLELNPVLKVLPVVSSVLIMRSGLQGAVDVPLSLASIFTTLAGVALLLLAAARVLRHEEAVTGSFSGSPSALFRRLLGRTVRAPKGTVNG
ncbi:ABC transporter permease [Candidatus Fermentibacteria bacterium]|nr:ABC transporter permease [Candidatus Fermentibacteria bacterium]